MGRGKKRPLPVVPPPMKSLKRARQVTSKFHTITEELNRLKTADAAGGGGGGAARKKQKQTKQAGLSVEKRRLRIRALEKELDELGGRDAYQQASVISTKHCSSSKWVAKVLGKRNLRPNLANGDAPAKLLEVGAINTELLDKPWLDVRAIDLNSQHRRIETRDFFDLAADAAKGTRYAHLVMSMVINCIPTPEDRGRALLLVRRLLEPGGLFFLTLPVSCLTPPEELGATPAVDARARAGAGAQARAGESTAGRGVEASRSDGHKNDNGEDSGEAEGEHEGGVEGKGRAAAVEGGSDQAAAQGVKARAAAGFDRLVFESILTHPRLGFEIIREDSRTAPKVQFYCLRAPAATATAKEKAAGGAWSPPKSKGKGKKRGNKEKWEFSVVLPP